MTPKQLAQRQLAPIRTGLYVRAASGQRLRDRKVGRLVHKLQVVMPWLATADEPACRAVAVAVEPSVAVRAVHLERAMRPEELEPIRLGDERGDVRHGQPAESTTDFFSR